MGEIGAEVEAATRALEAMIGAQLAAGTNRCVLAATCIWGGVKEMSEVTSSESAARPGYVGSGCAPWKGGAFQWV